MALIMSKFLILIIILWIDAEEDKNKARWAWPDGPDGSISMGWRKGKPISYIDPLQIKNYEKIRT